MIARRAHERWAGGLLLALAVLTMGTGVYFLAVRPPMLPEDVRWTGVQLTSLPPAFASWLTIVFHTWGGFIVGFGIVLAGVATTLLTSRPRVTRWAVCLGVAVAFGRFLYSNIILASDFVWFIAILFALALATIAALVRLRRAEV